MDILLLKLENDITKEITQYIQDKQYPETNVKDIIMRHINPELFEFKQKTYDETKCQARLWCNVGLGHQCTHNKKDGTDYCNKHNRMLKIDGVLRFGDIRETKPKYDQIKLKDGEKCRLPWIHSDPISRLQNILDKQQKKIIEASPKLVIR